MSNKKRPKGGAPHRRRRRPAPSTAARPSLAPEIETPGAPATRQRAPRARRVTPAVAADVAPATSPVTPALAPDAADVPAGAQTDVPTALMTDAPEAPAAEDTAAAPLLDAAPVTGGRLRRARTLGDVVQPEYATPPPSEAPPAAAAEEERPVARSAPSRPLRPATTTHPLAEITGPLRAAPSGPLAGASSGPLDAGAPAPQHARVTSMPRGADDPLRTVPFPRRPIPRPPRGPLSGQQAAEEAPAAPAPTSAPEAPARAPLATRLLWSIQRGSPRLVLTAALGHVCAGLGLAVAASVVFLVSGAQGYYLLIMAAVTLAGGIAGYALVTTERPTWAGALALVAAQLAALAIFLSASGAQVAVLLFAPAAAYLAQRMGGRAVAIVSGAGAVIVYLAFVIVGLIWPVTGFSSAAVLFFDLFAAVAGTGLLLLSLLLAAAARERSEAAARARLYELRLLRARVAEARETVERDARVLEEALVSALRGRGIEPVSAEGPLSPVAEITNDVADRLATLQKDREDRLRLEGAVRAAVRALERGWLGQPWVWPEPSGTLLDQLIGFLRTPRPPAPGTSSPWSDETPTFVPRPARGDISRPLAEPRSDPDIARIFAAVDEQWDPWSER